MVDDNVNEFNLPTYMALIEQGPLAFCSGMNTYFKTVSAVVLKESIIPIKRRPLSSCIESGKILFSNGVLVRSVSPIENVRGVRHICDVCEKPLASKQVLEDHKKS